MAECTFTIGSKKWRTPGPSFNVSLFGPNVTLFDIHDKCLLGLQDGKVMVKDKGSYNLRQLLLEDFVRGAPSEKQQTRIFRQLAITLWYNTNKESLAGQKPVDNKQVMGWRFKRFSELSAEEQTKWVDKARVKHEQDAPHATAEDVVEESSNAAPSPAVAPTQPPPEVPPRHHTKDRKHDQRHEDPATTIEPKAKRRKVPEPSHSSAAVSPALAPSQPAATKPHREKGKEKERRRDPVVTPKPGKASATEPATMPSSPNPRSTASFFGATAANSRASSSSSLPHMKAKEAVSQRARHSIPRDDEDSGDED